MAQNSILVTMKLAELATVTAGCATPTSMPPANAINYQPGAVVRLLDLGAATLTIDLTAALAASNLHGLVGYRYVVIVGATITSAGTVEARTGASAVAVGSVGTSDLVVGPQNFWLVTHDKDGARFPVRHTVIDLGSQRTEPFLYLGFVDAANPAGFLDIGIVIPHPGYPFQMIQKPSYGVNEELRSILAVSGARHLQIRPRPRTREISLQTMGTTQTQYQAAFSATQRGEVLDQWLGLEESVGVSESVAIVTHLAPAEGYMNEIIYGTLTGLRPVVIPEEWGGSEWSLSLEEMR